MNIKPVINLSDGNIDTFIRKYHFLDEDKERITGIYYTIENIIKPVIYYEIYDKSTGFDFLDDYSGSYAVVAVSLDTYVDRLIQIYTDADDLLTATIIDDLCLEIMMKSYSVMTDDIAHRYGLYVEKYMFAGEHFDIRYVPDIIVKSGAKGIEYNEYNFLKPLKSVAFMCILSDENKNNICKSGICKNCTNITCDMRMEEL